MTEMITSSQMLNKGGKSSKQLDVRCAGQRSRCY